MEVGATYRTRAGKEVELISDRVDLAGYVPVFANGYHCCERAEGLVRVVPTPADRWIMFDSDVMVSVFAGEGAAVKEAERWNVRIEAEVYRVARFTFAEWIDTDEATDG